MLGSKQRAFTCASAGRARGTRRTLAVRVQADTRVTVRTGLDIVYVRHA